ncbi:MAG: esterase-like activity of phytase family protein [Planctomycetota bacterium]|nr:esterase-like activity of phytase family protein [Planctomycetota bacterium]
MAHSHQSQLLSKAAAALHFCGVVVVFFISSTGNGEAEEPLLESGKSLQCQVVASGVFPEIILAQEDPSVSQDVPVVLGGISDVTVEKAIDDSGQFVIRLLTDRGPSRKIETADGKQRVFLNPSFVPTVLVFGISGCSLDESRGESKKLKINLQSQFSLQTPRGKVITGRSNGLEGDDSIANPSGEELLAPDVNGIDPEGCALLADGTFWLCEEYRPSVLCCEADGTVIKRFIPKGVKLPSSDIQIVENLPAHYAKRRANRGFESLALSPDESTIWALMQSPFDNEAAERSGNVRLLGCNTENGQPTSEYVYRLGDPAAADFLTGGVVPNDGKLCAMAAIGPKKLLILEQSDDGDAKMYRCDLDKATNVLGDDKDIDGVRNLSRVGVTPVKKTLVADLANLLPSFASDITAGQWQPEPDEKVAGLKLEGLAVLDSNHIIVANDNDFNVDSAFEENEPERQSCVWVVSLPQPL